MCYGTGKERFKFNRMANVSLHFDAQGGVTPSAIADSPYMKGKPMKQPDEVTISPLLTSAKRLQEECESLIARALLLAPEDEVFEPDDEYTMQEMAALRSRLSTMRRGIDFINKGLAIRWKDDYPGDAYIDEDTDTIWWVGETKGKRIIDPEVFYAWLATKNADELVKLVSAGAIKVGGMSSAERDTMLDETPRNTDVSIQNKPRS